LLMKIKYSPDAVDKLKDIKTVYGCKTYQKIRSSIQELSVMPKKGALVEDYIGIPNPYRCLHILKHYIFYRIDKNKKLIYITEVFNEREDFLNAMFGVNLRTQESVEYWGD